MSTAQRRVAIACQGGGSHTAFTAGVLAGLFRPEVTDRYRIVGLSGTSGGAICALLAWSALIDGDPTLAAPRLSSFWAANSASGPVERAANSWLLWLSQLSRYVAMPEISPYQSPIPVTATAQLRQMLDDGADFPRLAAAAAAAPGAPALLLGAVDVLSGDFKAFDSRRGEITAEAVLASAAIPNLFRSVHVNGGTYWDGLFSQNPPVHELLDTDPDEIWVIQINPKQRSTEPQSTLEISDRRNELAGNLSLYQELDHIEFIDSLIERGLLVGEKYRPTVVRIIEKSRSRESQALGTASKMNRDPAFLSGLIADGRRRAAEFLAGVRFEDAWRDGDTEQLLTFFADDCLVSSEPPFQPLPEATGKQAVLQFLADRLANRVQVNPTRKQSTAEQLRWDIRSTHPETGERVEGLVRATVRGGEIVEFRLGPRHRRRS